MTYRQWKHLQDYNVLTFSEERNTLIFNIHRVKSLGRNTSIFYEKKQRFVSYTILSSAQRYCKTSNLYTASDDFEEIIEFWKILHALCSKVILHVSVLNCT